MKSNKLVEVEKKVVTTIVRPKKITIQVTVDDIKKGKPRSAAGCAIACALRREGFTGVSVLPCGITTNQFANTTLPWKARYFVCSFDRAFAYPFHAKPLTFKIKPQWR